jgi:hypothetical protein
MRKLIYLFLFLAAVFTLNCQALSSSQSVKQNFSVVTPEGWTKFTSSEYFMLTREGVFSQYILVLQRRTKEAFSHTKSRLRKDMSPKEAAGVITDELSSPRWVGLMDSELYLVTKTKVDETSGPSSMVS